MSSTTPPPPTPLGKQLEELQCHFNWRPDQGSTKTLDIFDAIAKVEQKLQRDPHLAVAHLATLCYLHTVNPAVDAAKAKHYLSEAEKLDEELRAAAPDRRLVSQYVLLANRLLLQQLHSGRPLTRREAEPTLQRLNELWAVEANRACVFAVKGVTYKCFGPKKFDEGAEAYRLALELVPDTRHRYDWLYGRANLLACCTRQTVNKPADEEQLQLWRQAAEAAEAAGIEEAMFYANYAEALIKNKDKKTLCRELMNKSVELLFHLPQDQQQLLHLAFIIGFKVYRLLRDWDNRRKLLQRADRIKGVVEDPSFFLELANEEIFVNKNKELARQLLQHGLSLSTYPGHIHLQLRLLELDWQCKTPFFVVMQYDTMRIRFSTYNKNVSLIMFMKALYLLQQCCDVPEAVETCVTAWKMDRAVAERIGVRRKDQFFVLLQQQSEQHQKFKEYVAWFLENVFRPYYCSLDPLQLHREVLDTDDDNFFAREHLGRCLLQRNSFIDAAACFRRLPDDNKDRKRLLAMAIFRDATCGIEALHECLELGCLDACDRVLAILEAEKEGDDAREQVLGDRPVFFRREAYELCARIQLLLDDPEAFFIEPSEESLEVFKATMRLRVVKQLELDRLTYQSTDDQRNLMRCYRLDAAKQRLLCRATGSRDLPELCDAIVSTLKEAKESLDRCFQQRFKTKDRSFSYVHAFDSMKKKLNEDGDYKKKFNQLQSEPERKKFEMEQLLQLLKNDKNLTELDSVREHLKNSFVTVAHNVDTANATRAVFDFMAKREHRILANESRWLIRWVYSVNSEKHTTELSVSDLDAALQRDADGEGEALSAYDMAHRAAEFAEETQLVLLPQAQP